MALQIFPATLKQANAMITQFHRHHRPVRAHRFSIGCRSAAGIHGYAVVARPAARNVDQYTVAEVSRLVTDGTPNACSILYAAAARAAAAMGFSAIQTYILESEPGTSLRAAGWEYVHTTAGGDWNRPSRGGRRTDQPQCRKQLWRKVLAQ